ncbi:T9SS type A sorting domain-containing protein [Empedobacter falsenii]
MKKNLLALVALGAMYSASAQTAYIKDKAVVAVKPYTLMYMGNGLEISSSTPNTVINEGNIQINLNNLTPGNYTTNDVEGAQYKFENFNTDGITANDGKNFVNKWTDKNNYGQLMITGNSNNKANTTLAIASSRVYGKVTMEQPYVSPTNFNWLPIAIPFTSSTRENFSMGNFLNASLNLAPSEYIYTNEKDPGMRYSTTVMRWSNASYYYTNIAPTSDINEYYNTFILNLTKGGLKSIFETGVATPNSRINYVGIPFGLQVFSSVRNTNIGEAPWSNLYSPTDQWKQWSIKKNPVGEYYYSYIGESFEMLDVAQTSSTFGKYLINFSNPYTNNMDLAAVFSSEVGGNFRNDLIGVQKVGDKVLWDKVVGNKSPKTSLKAMVPNNAGSSYNPNLISKSWMGDKEALLLRPFEKATFKLQRDVTTSYQLYLGETNTYWPSGYKTFNMQSSATITGPLPKSSTTTNEMYQLGLQVDAADESTSNRIYFAALTNDVTGQKAQYEIEYGDFGSDSGFWLVQENKDETYDQGSYLFLNAFNINDYVAKPLHMAFYKNPNNTNNKFTLTANLAEESTLNDGLEKLSNGNKYYFVDTKENKTIEITKDFTYTFTANESSFDRFIVYWNGLPKTLGTNEGQINKDKTFIYKNNTGTNSIRFAKKNLTASLNVYNMAGQLILTKENVNTASDFAMNNIPNGMYIVNVIYSDNTVETLKTIFKNN